LGVCGVAGGLEVRVSVNVALRATPELLIPITVTVYVPIWLDEPVAINMVTEKEGKPEVVLRTMRKLGSGETAVESETFSAMPETRLDLTITVVF